MVQACAACGRLRHPPRWSCPWCGSPELEWLRLSGRGRIWSYVIAHPPVLPAFEKRVPLPIALVELDEDPRVRIVADVVDAQSTSLRIGARVEAVFEAIDDEVGVPHWKLLNQSEP